MDGWNKNINSKHLDTNKLQDLTIWSFRGTTFEDWLICKFIIFISFNRHPLEKKSKILLWGCHKKYKTFGIRGRSVVLSNFVAQWIMDNNQWLIWKYSKQAEAEVVSSSSSVQFKIESDLVCLRFIKFILD